MANTDPFPPLRTTTSSPDETSALGAAIGRRLLPGVIVLEGELGAGKTTFVKGIARGLGFASAARETGSPTFVLAREYPGRLRLIHIDLYRLESIGPETADWLEETFEQDAVVAVEWGERARALLPRNHLWIRLSHAEGDQRLIECRTQGSVAFKESGR